MINSINSFDAINSFLKSNVIQEGKKGHDVKLDTLKEEIFTQKEITLPKLQPRKSGWSFFLYFFLSFLIINKLCYK